YQGDPESPDYDREKYQWEQEKNKVDTSLCFVDDSLYNSLLTENNIKIPDDGRLYGVLWDTYTDVENDGTGTKWSSQHVFEKTDYPVSLKLSELKYHIGNYDYAYTDWESDEDGNITEKCYYMDRNAESQDDGNYTVFSHEEAVSFIEVNVAGVIDTAPAGVIDSVPAIIYPESSLGKFASPDTEWYNVTYYITADDHNYVAGELQDIMDKNFSESGISSYGINDVRNEEEMMRSMVMVINVFAYGFIVLISLVAITNIFNTISTNIMVRRREFAMLKSTGMSDRKMRRMMNYECILYGIKGLIYGMPVSFLISFVLYRWIRENITVGFYIPWYSIAISVGSVFVVVFATMLYS
ncbi:MAG: ABC transporter permease, partial [Lachnospiraceae bacterium]|nr:ABC transporter permease [Lachnospiraceae bacterium]